MNRKITITLEIIDKEASKFIWDAHLNQKVTLLSGCKVRSISEGSLDEIIQEEIEAAHDPIWNKDS